MIMIVHCGAVVEFDDVLHSGNSHTLALKYIPAT
jgi:hypothetical protein